MTELDENQIQQAKESIVGVKIWFTIESVLYGIGAFVFMVLAIVIPILVYRATNEPVARIASSVGFIIGFVMTIVFLVLYLIALNAINNRRRIGYSFGMAMLILSMFWVPIGTVIGAILLTRFNTDLVRKYFNY